MTGKRFLKYLPEIAGALTGAIGGYLYWRHIGCASGTCTIKSHWYYMVPWGALAGYLIGSVIKDIFIKAKKSEKKEGV